MTYRVHLDYQRQWRKLTIICKFLKIGTEVILWIEFWQENIIVGTSGVNVKKQTIFMYILENLVNDFLRMKESEWLRRNDAFCTMYNAHLYV